MKKWLSLFLSLLLIFNLLAPSFSVYAENNSSKNVKAAASSRAVSSATVYIDGVSGNDKNAGTSGAPVKTFKTAYSKLQSSGGTIYMLNTVYVDFRMAFNTSAYWDAKDGVRIATGGEVLIKRASSNKNEMIIVKSGGRLELNGGTIDGNGSAVTATDGIVWVQSGGELALRGSTLTNSKTNNNGAGIYNDGTMTLESGSVTNNTTAGGGAGIYNTGKLSITGGTISDNTTGSVNGGGGVVNAGTMTMTGGTITGNWANYGGGIYCHQNSKLTINDGSVIQNNEADDGGGGIHLNGTNTLNINGGSIANNKGGNYGGGIIADIYTTITMSGGSITGNSATHGGGVYNKGKFTFTGGSISNNKGTDDAGGVYNEGALILDGGSITGNSAIYGGGIHCYNSNSAPKVTFKSGSISNNTATVGGGITLYSNSVVTMTGGSISNNGNESTTQGGGIHNNNGTFNLTAGTISSNTAKTGAGVYQQGTMNMSQKAVVNINNDIYVVNPITIPAALSTDVDTYALLTPAEYTSGYVLVNVNYDSTKGSDVLYADDANTTQKWSLTPKDPWKLESTDLISSINTNNQIVLHTKQSNYTLTINYYSNYATEAFSGAYNTVGADKNVLVYTWKTNWSGYADNLHDYDYASASVYLDRFGYEPTLEWGTKPDGGIILSEHTNFNSAVELAAHFGIDLTQGDATLNLYPQWRPDMYTNHINHYAFGFQNSEGNAGNGIAYELLTEFPEVQASTKFTIDESYGTTIPNGFYLSPYFGTDSISSSNGAWTKYPFGTEVLQENEHMYFNLEYYPKRYSITYKNGSNSDNPTSYTVLYGVSLKDPEPKEGYTFVGWHDGTKYVTGINEGKNATFRSAEDLYTQLAARTTGNITLEAIWKANPDTPYRVQHWLQNVDGNASSHDSTNYTLKETQNLTGTTDSKVTPAVKSYGGFKSPTAQTVTIKADGSTVVNYYYTRNSYTVTLNKGTGISSVSGAGTYLYGESVTINATAATGYTWSKWTGTHRTTTQKYTFTMPASNVTDTANAIANTDTVYKVKHWQQNVDGTASSQDSTNYTLKETENLSGVTGASVTPSVKSYTGFKSPDAVKVSIKADGSTVVNYYYTRNSYTVTLNKGTGISSVSGAGSYLYGQSVTINATAATGYTWSKWTGTHNTTTQKVTFTMPASNVTDTANAIGNSNTVYKVKHWQQNVDGTASSQDDKNYTLKETETFFGTTNTKVIPSVKSYTGFKAPSAQEVTIKADGSTVVNYYYTRNSYTVTLNKGTGISSVSGAGSYLYGQSVTINATVATGYTWKSWTGTHSTTTQKYTFTMPAFNITDTANATPKSVTVTFNKNDGSTSTASQSFTYGVSGNQFGYNTDGTPKWSQTGQFGQWDRTGYTLLGWSHDKDATKETYAIYSNVTDAWINTYSPSTNLYAVWTANTDTPYKVQHWLQNLDGNASSQDSSNYTLKETQNLTGTTDSKVTPAVKSYTGFKAPSTQTVTIAADGSTVVNYYYTRNSYTVTLNKGTGISSVSGAGSYLYGESVTINATVTTGYTWNKWSGTHSTTTQKYTFTMPASNVTDTANATPKSIVVTFHRNISGSDITIATQTFTYGVSGQSFSDKGWTRTGYELSGWSFDKNAAAKTYELLSGVSNDWINTYSPTADLYAVWIPVSYSIKYDGNGATSGSMKNSSHTYDVKSTLTKNVYERSGYTFKGWNTKENGSGKSYADMEEIINLSSTKGDIITLYAQWDKAPELKSDGTLEFYEGTRVTKTDLLEGLTATDAEEGNLTDDIKIIKLIYSAGKIVNGIKTTKTETVTFTNDMPENYLLDTWFMQLDQDDSPVIHKITYEVTDSTGNISTLDRDIHVKYNTHPEIMSEDRYFTLKDAQDGKITIDELLKEVSVTDVEDDALYGEGSLDDRVQILGYQADEFVEFTGSGYVVLTLKVHDSMGPEGECTCTDGEIKHPVGKETLKQLVIYVVDGNEQVDGPEVKYVRFIDEANYCKNENKKAEIDSLAESLREEAIRKAHQSGGLHIASKWYEDVAYKSLITESFAKESGTAHVYNQEDIERIKNF